MRNSLHFSSKKNYWQTPIWLVKSLDNVYKFSLDAAASKYNAICSNYYTEEDNSLVQDWSKFGNRVWCNPPYGKILSKFIEKAFIEATTKSNLESVTLLIPAKTDTKYWYKFCRFGSIGFITGRLKFIDPENPDCDDCAPFPSAIVEFGKNIKPNNYYVTHKELWNNTQLLYERFSK